MKKIIIGTRGSKLALWQAHFVQSELKKIGYESELNIIKTKGDQIQHLSFDKIEGKGFFTKEIEDAILNQEADLAIHSMKDLPTTSPDGLVIAGVSYRANPGDLLLLRMESVDQNLPLHAKENAIIGTSSVRRKSSLIHLRNDLSTEDIRGNVPTRIDKLRQGNFDGILLASAGIERLELDVSDLHTVPLHPHEFVPAPAQGVLAYQCHEENIDLRRIIQKLHHPDVSACTNVERKVLQMMDGGCHLPLGVYCSKDIAGNYHCHAAFSPDENTALIKTNLSQSTTSGLAKKIFSMINETIVSGK